MTHPTNTADNELRQKLAAIEHERWSDWQKWCHKIICQNDPNLQTLNVLERWEKQIATPYSQLTPAEKASDLEQVDRYWPLVEEYVNFHNIQLLEALVGEKKTTYHEHYRLPESNATRSFEAIPVSAVQRMIDKFKEGL